MRTHQEADATSPWYVVRYGTSSEVVELLRLGQNRPTTFGADPVTGAPLAFAALQRADALVLHLCETAGLSWQGEDLQRNNAWHWAAPREGMVPWLLEHPHVLGPDGGTLARMDAPNAHRHTPLMIACGITSVGGDNHEDNALPLLSAGANARTIAPNGDTLLHMMALPTLARALVTAGDPVDGPTPDGETPLFRAVSLGLSEVIDVLLELGASPCTPYQGVSPLRRAITDREFEVAERLVQAGADPWSPDADGACPWDAAERWPNLRSRWEQQRLRTTLAEATPERWGPRPRSRL